MNAQFVTVYLLVLIYPVCSGLLPRISLSKRRARMKDILFIFGPGRGGTTFLNKIMSEWFSVGTGPEGTFIPAALKKAERLGDLSIADNSRKLAKFISQAQMFEIIRKRWPADYGFDVTPDDILGRMKEKTVACAIYAAFEAVADYRGQDRVGNKNPGYILQLSLLHELFPDNARYLFILRDGRDVALSLKPLTWGGHSTYEAAKIWRDEVFRVSRFKQQVAPEKLLTIKYEELLLHPGKTISKIGEFLGQENMPELIAGYQKEAEQNPYRKNFHKWRESMSQHDQKVYEAVAGPALAECGYEIRFPEARLNRLQLLNFEIQRFIRLVKINLYHILSTLPQDKKKWQSSVFSAVLSIKSWRR